MNETYKIRSVGGALVVTIPQQIAKLVPLEAGDEVRFSMSGVGDVLITRKRVVAEKKRKTGARAK